MGAPPELPEVCREWLARWFAPEEAVAAERAGARWSAEHLIRWCYALANVAARDAAGVTWRALGAHERAAAHLALAPVIDEASASRAIAVIESSASANQERGRPFSFLLSTRRVVEFAYCLDNDWRDARVLDPLYLEGIFGKAGALDMSIGRSLLGAHSRDPLLATYRRALLAPHRL
jgi:hypothetical protein